MLGEVLKNMTKAHSQPLRKMKQYINIFGKYGNYPVNRKFMEDIFSHMSTKENPIHKNV